MKKKLAKDYPYSTRITANYNVVTPQEKDEYLAKASLDSLKGLLNVSEEQVENNPDLLYISADLWVGGMANKNDDAITVEDTISLAKNIPHKYLDLEHDDSIIVGSLFSYGFREYTDERNTIDEASVKNYQGPIVASGGGFIWRSVNEKLADLLVEASDKNSENYNIASFSWEVYFKDFAIMEGSKFVSEATIIEDKEEIEKRLPHLKAKGGSGVYEGKRIYRLVKGPKIFLGAGIVKNPAADVKGILTLIDKEEIQEKKTSKAGIIICNQKIAANINKNSIKISQPKKINVKQDIDMKIKDLKEYTTVVASLDQKEEVDHKTLAALQAFDVDAYVEKAKASAIADALREKSAEFAEQKKALENEKAQAAEEKAKIEKELSEIKEKSTATEKELDEMKQKLIAEEKNRLFNERMEALDEEYELDEDVRKVVASQIKSLDEEAYASWLEGFQAFAKEKSKKYKAEKEAEMKKKEEEDKKKMNASVSDEEKSRLEKEEAEKALAAAQKNSSNGTPSSQHEEITSLADKFKDAKLEIE